MNEENQTTIEIELNKLDKLIKHAIKICLEDSGLSNGVDVSKIGLNVVSYKECKNIIDYLYLKIKEFFLSDYYVRALEYFNTLPYNHNKERILTSVTLYESDYIDRCLFYKNNYEYNPVLNSTKNNEKYDDILKGVRKHLVDDMKEISNYSFSEEKDINDIYKKDYENLSNDSLRNFYYWVNSKYNQYVFLFGCTPVKYINFLDKNKLRKTPLFFEFATIVYADLFFNTTNHLSKANTSLNSLKKNTYNNNISSLIKSYNESLSIISKIEDKLLLEKNYIRLNALIHYTNKIFAYDFFKSYDSLFIKYISNNIDFKRLSNYSKKIYGKDNAVINPMTSINIDTMDIVQNLQLLNILEFGVKYNIDFSKFDCLIDEEYFGFTEKLIISKLNIESFCKFLYLLYNNTSLVNLNLSYPSLSTDIKKTIKIFNDQLNNLNSGNNKHSKLNPIDEKSDLYIENYLLFSYLFLYPTRHYSLSVQGRKREL